MPRQNFKLMSLTSPSGRFSRPPAHITVHPVFLYPVQFSIQRTQRGEVLGLKRVTPFEQINELHTLPGVKVGNHNEG